jgi:hypothetical protein
MMRSAAHLSITTARADALFASALQRSDDPSAEQVQQAIAAAVRAFGTRGCAARVARAYGEHPETAAPRMRWARAVVAAASGGAHPAPMPRPGTQPAGRSGLCRAA